MSIVYLVQHSYEYEAVKGYVEEDVHVVGIYSTQEKAEEAIELVKNKPGFLESLNGEFFISKFHVDWDTNWLSGFVTV